MKNLKRLVVLAMASVLAFSPVASHMVYASEAFVTEIEEEMYQDKEDDNAGIVVYDPTISGNIVMDADDINDSKCSIYINSGSFPDDTFREYIKSNIDTDSDGMLSYTERENITKLYFRGINPEKPIINLKGIEYFFNLEHLVVSDEKIWTLDLSKCKELKVCEASNMDMNTITFADNSKITFLDVNNTKVTSLDLSKLPALNKLICTECNISELNITNNEICADIRDFFKVGNQKSDKTINIYATKEQADFYNEHLYSDEYDDYLRVNFKIVDCDKLYLNEIFVPNASIRNILKNNYDANKDNVLDAEEISKVTEIIIEDKSISTLKGIEYLSELKILTIGKFTGTELDFSNNKQLTNVRITGGNVKSVDLSENHKLELVALDKCGLKNVILPKENNIHFLMLCNNALENIDVSSLDKLTTLRLENNKLSKLNLYNNSELGILRIDNNRLSEIDTRFLVKLYSLNISNNNISKLNLENNKRISTLNCECNLLKEINIEDLNLTNLTCYQNYITELDISNTNLLMYNNDNQALFGCNKENNNVKVIMNKQQLNRFEHYKDLEENKNVEAIEADGSNDNKIALSKDNFKDEVFLEFIRRECDLDKDGYLSETEIRRISSITIDAKGIKDVTGIEHLYRLERVNIYHVDNSEVVDLTKNKELKYVIFYYCDIKNIVLSGMSKLEDVSCHASKVENIDISGCYNINQLGCDNSNIKQLDVSGTAVLKNEGDAIYVGNQHMLDDTPITIDVTMTKEQADIFAMFDEDTHTNDRVNVVIHEHNVDTTKFINDGNKHMNECSDCGAKLNAKTHIVGISENNPNELVCTVCGTDLGITSGHVHDAKLQNELAATCETDGYNSYYECECGRYYVDPKCTEEIVDIEAWKKDAGLIKAGHTWEEVLADNGATVLKCLVCGKTTTKTDAPQIDNPKPEVPDSDEPGVDNPKPEVPDSDKPGVDNPKPDKPGNDMTVSRNDIQVLAKTKVDIMPMFSEKFAGSDKASLSIDKFVSSDTKIASVTKKGVLKGKKNGDVIITALHKVNKNTYEEIGYIKLSIKQPSLIKTKVVNVLEEKVDLSAYLTNLPDGSQVVWSVPEKKTSVATISNDGVLVSKGKGKVVVTAVINGTVKVKCKVNVKPAKK